MKLFTKKQIKFFVFFIVIIALALWLFTLELEGEAKKFALDYGYFGLFVLSFVGGINLVFPLPHLIFIPPLLDVGLSPLLITFIAALGTTLGDGVSYLLGAAGNEAFQKNLSPFRRFIQNIFTKHPKLVFIILFFWAATVPVPNELWVVPAGISGYGIGKILAIAFLGNLVFNFIAIHIGSTLIGV